ncbi:MAG: hypothetical protein ACOYNR_15990 [Blastocatellia bacterium]
MVERLEGTRIVARPAALDALGTAQGCIWMRLAADELLIIGEPLEKAERVLINDPHAIVLRETGFAGIWQPAEAALAFLACACEWELPKTRPAFAQGMVAGLPVKLWLESDRVLFVTAAPYAADLEERMR